MSSHLRREQSCPLTTINGRQLAASQRCRVSALSCWSFLHGHQDLMGNLPGTGAYALGGLYGSRKFRNLPTRVLLRTRLFRDRDASSHPAGCNRAIAGRPVRTHEFAYPSVTGPWSCEQFGHGLATSSMDEIKHRVTEAGSERLEAPHLGPRSLSLRNRSGPLRCLEGICVASFRDLRRNCHGNRNV